jgi:hypothetical protein
MPLAFDAAFAISPLPCHAISALTFAR